jgi:hypothetical protein
VRTRRGDENCSTSSTRGGWREEGRLGLARKRDKKIADLQMDLVKLFAKGSEEEIEHFLMELPAGEFDRCCFRFCASTSRW